MHLMQFTAFQARGSVCMAQQQLGRKESTRHAENSGDAGSLSQEDPLEKGMATHSSILAWRLPWTEEPSGLCD